MSKKFRPNWNTVRELLGDHAVAAFGQWSAQHDANAFARGHVFSIILNNLERRAYTSVALEADPQEISRVMLGTSDCASKHIEHFTLENMRTFPANWFRRGLPKYYLYNVDFAIGERNAAFADETLSAFGAGYVGITSRLPHIRFKEHIAHFANGDGHYFHASWRSLMGAFPDSRARFHVFERAESLDEAYELEEKFVRENTLAPIGLNAIPGGREGLKYIHLWREDGTLADIDTRDAALVDLERGRSVAAAHYRKGHIRKLPERFKKRTTWVSPCWVNLPATEIAA